MSSLHPAVVIGLESNYTIVEGDSTQVCAVLLQGTLERDAVVTLTTVAGTASGEYLSNAYSSNDKFMIICRAQSHNLTQDRTFSNHFIIMSSH